MKRSLVRSRRRRAPRARRLVVADSWQRWVADNLLRGVELPDLVQGLQDGGVPGEQARRTVATIAASAGLAVARACRRDLRRHAQVLRLLTAVERSPLHIERREAPDLESLHRHYWERSAPAIFTDVVSRWRAQWTPRLLKERYGSVEIEACTGREADAKPDANWKEHRERMTLAAFVDRMQTVDRGSNDLYLIANNRNTARPELRSLWDDVVLPKGWFAEERLPFGSALWLGPAGTLTPLHHDTSNILFCQIHGRKRVTLAPPWSVPLLESARGVYNRRSADDLAREGIPAITVDVAPGEALFIPVGWWHEVLALDASVSLAINAFARANGYGWYGPGTIR